MSKDEILFLRNMLLDKRSSILDRVRKLAAAWQELEERAIELEEEAQKASIAKPYDQLDSRGKLEIEQIDLALTKMTIGEYGICESCGDDISPKRLEVLPWARLCVDCAREYEKLNKSLPRTNEAISAARVPEEFQEMTNDQIVHAIYERLQVDERIDTEELKISVRKGVVYLDGAVAGEHEHDIILQILGDVMGFSAVVDRISANELMLEHNEYEESVPGGAGLGDRLFYDHDDVHEGTYESTGKLSSEPDGPVNTL